jgi:hypothetical protein
MDEVLRERLRRTLESLPDDKLFQVLDYIEFLESRYAVRDTPLPTGLQRFAERLQDRLRARSVAPRLISGTVGALGVARKVVDGVTEAGRGLVRDLTPDAAPAAPRRPAGREIAAIEPLGPHEPQEPQEPQEPLEPQEPGPGAEAGDDGAVGGLPAPSRGP